MAVYHSDYSSAGHLPSLLPGAFSIQHPHMPIFSFPAPERHWYQRAHSECAANARRALPERALALAAAEGASRRASGAGLPLADPLLDRVLTHSEQKKLLLPLLRLRQACCHPQVGGWVSKACGRTCGKRLANQICNWHLALFVSSNLLI